MSQGVSALKMHHRQKTSRSPRYPPKFERIEIIGTDIKVTRESLPNTRDGFYRRQGPIVIGYLVNRKRPLIDTIGDLSRGKFDGKSPSVEIILLNFAIKDFISDYLRD